MNYFKVSIGIFVLLAASRFVPHPPNFTSLLALSFYVPALLGLKFIPSLLISFAITDFVIGYHFGTHWTWGSVLLIGLISVYFKKNIFWRISGALLGATIFFLVTNFGVWATGQYGLNIVGFKTTYILAIPFFTYSLISTLVFSSIIETILKIYLYLFKKEITNS